MNIPQKVDWTHTEILAAMIVGFCGVMCIPVFGWQNVVLALMILVFLGIFYFGVGLWGGWGLIAAWALICLVIVPCLFLLEGGSIQPSILGRMGGDVEVSQSISQWGLGYLRQGIKVPEWNPSILGGMPTEGSLLFVTHGHPVGMANLQMNGYRAEWENMGSKPIRFTWANWLGNSLSIFFVPLGYAILCVMMIYYLVIL